MASKPKTAPKKAPAKKAVPKKTAAQKAEDAPARQSQPHTQAELDPRVEEAAAWANNAGVEAEQAIVRAAEQMTEDAPNTQEPTQQGGGGGGAALLDDENTVDVALGALCQSYSHALSLAFHDAVAGRQRRSALLQAALAHAVEEISTSKPDDFEARMKQLKAGLDVLDAPNGDDMAAYAGITQQFRDAATELMNLRSQLKS
ncbi:RebB family R body protein [Kordiimonas sp.]|uniref:RebB family R body protein n=1 Tax=Kordiimonas sp. TaxID=1970157 RepID=UPI003A923A95